MKEKKITALHIEELMFFYIFVSDFIRPKSKKDFSARLSNWGRGGAY